MDVAEISCPFSASWVENGSVEGGTGTPTHSGGGEVVAGRQQGLPGPPWGTVFDGLVLAKHMCLRSVLCNVSTAESGMVPP